MCASSWFKVLLAAGLSLLGFVATAPASSRAEDVVTPRARVIIDNDFGGDPDGLFQLAQHLLSPSVEIRAIIGSHHYPGDFYGSPGTAERAVVVARELLLTMGLDGRVPLLAGAEGRIEKANTPLPSEGARFIVREAMRDDTKTPLYIACGAGLTNVASAWLMEPKIAERIRLVWIGGPEHAGLAKPPPGHSHVEYNLGIDLGAARVVFNESRIPVWQVPRDAYRQCLVSYSELQYRLGGSGKLGQFLLNRLRELMAKSNRSLGEVYALGDSPLVLLTALQSSWEADPSSSDYVEIKTPRITDSGGYGANPEGRRMRVYTRLDTRLMFEDLFAKVAEFDRAQP